MILEMDIQFLRAARGSFSTGALSADMITAWYWIDDREEDCWEIWRVKKAIFDLIQEGRCNFLYQF
jgi:hypothetical protein